MVSYFLLGVTFAFAAAVQPGPLQAYLVAQTLANGWRRTILASFAPLLSDAPIIALVLLVLSQVPPAFARVLQLVGGAFLIYLAVEAFKTYRNYDTEKVLQPQPGQKTLFKAVFVNLLNPNPYLGWSLVMGPLLLKGWQEAPVYGCVLLASFYATLVLSLFGTIMLISLARNMGAKVNRLLIGGSAIALAGFGLYQLWSGVT
ncbi:MAG: lysine transporter LysE [Chloroflexota bacterium]|nr:MAG: lysine transporter LysE [Chloroflexota bacterium]